MLRDAFLAVLCIDDDQKVGPSKYVASEFVPSMQKDISYNSPSSNQALFIPAPLPKLNSTQLDKQE